MGLPGRDLVGDARRLAALRGLGVLDSPPEEDFDRLTRLAARTLKVPLVVVNFIDRERQFIKSTVGLPEPYAASREIPLEVGVCPDAFARPHPTLIDDMRRDERYRDNDIVRALGLVSYAGVPLKSSQGEKLGVFAAYDARPREWSREEILVLEDLAASVMTEIELRESEARYRRLVELSPEPIAVHSGGRMVYVNDAALRLVGARDRTEVEGRPVLEFVHPDYREMVVARVRQTQQEVSEAGVQSEKFLRLDGAVIDVEVVAIPTTFSGAPATQVVLRDVTERKRAERAMLLLTEASRALATSLELSRTLEAAARVAVPALADFCAVGVAGRGAPAWAIAHRDPEVQSALRALLGELPAPDAPIAPGDGPIASGAAWLRAAGAAVAGALGAAQSEPPHGVIALPLRARAGRVGTMVLARADRGAYEAPDVVLAEELSQRCAQAVDNALLYSELERTVRLRDDLLAAASHDLRSPLSSIRSRAALLRRKAVKGRLGDVGEVVENLGRIELSTTRMARLLEEMLDAASVQMGEGLKLDLGPTDAVALVNQLVDEERQVARGHVIQVHAPGEPLVGEWDAARLERVVANVLGNAVKYSPAGGEVDVTLETVQDSGTNCARLNVADRGVGIPPEELPNVFEPYFRASNVVRQFRGSGLGLAISRRIVEEHGGRIGVRNREGGGTEFTVILPLTAPGSPGRARSV